MPPKKVGLKTVTNPISSHFKPLTQLEIAAKTAQEQILIVQGRLQRETTRVQREEDEKNRTERSDDISLLVSSTSNMQIDIVNSIGEAINNLGDNVTTAKLQVPKQKKTYNKRPSEWQEIAIHHQNFKNIDKTIDTYNLLEINPNVSTWAVTLGRWLKDILKHKTKNFIRIPVIGEFLDNALADIVNNYFRNGVPMSNFIIRTTLMELMEKHNRHDLLERCNPDDPRNIRGKHWFLRLGDSWCNRFYKRHEFKSRVATTKMRNDLPADYEQKKTNFIYVLSKALGDNNVPDELVVNIDETAVQFVPSVTRTRCPKGAKRVRLIGIGMEKPQITTTFGGVATGKILEPVQDIFGGTTNRCHPNGGKTAPPENQYYDHTASHWQTPETFITYITKTILPYKTSTIANLNLPLNQKMVLILDLHYSHKTPEVLALLRANNVIAVFIPAGCTDLHQLCDVILNKSFKNGTKDAFVNYLSQQFISWADTLNRDIINDVFTINLALSVMKPLTPLFVERGPAAIKVIVI